MALPRDHMALPSETKAICICIICQSICIHIEIHMYTRSHMNMCMYISYVHVYMYTEEPVVFKYLVKVAATKIDPQTMMLSRVGGSRMPIKSGSSSCTALIVGIDGQVQFDDFLDVAQQSYCMVVC